jgi:tetratricopeptide (TPR) repeat protein
VGGSVVRRLASIVPPADLLQRVDKVEPTLRANRTIGTVGWAAAALSAAQLLIVVFTSQWWKGVESIDLAPWQFWGLIASVAVFVVAFTLVNWMRLWVRESRQPFRYTFFVGAFAPIEGTEPPPRIARRTAWLTEDLAERLSARIGRLSLLDPRYSKDAVFGEAHIHIGGSYGIRDEKIEVFPWVRLGPETEAATLAHPIRFSLKEEGLDGASGEKLVEWIYFSIASHVYARIREDVERKIALLPKRYFRAAAYFYEAQDYIRSHTLDAYRDARKLYADAIRFYDADWREPAQSRVRRLTAWFTRWRHVWSLYWRRKLSGVWPRLGRVELMVARAEIGYARALLDSRELAGLSGRPLNPVFEARPVAKRAVERLDSLRSSIPGRDAALFDARVTLAGALVAVDSPTLAENELDEAQREQPRRAAKDARYLYARGRVVTQQAQQFFRRAAELDPQLEVAQFHVALAADAYWRRRGTLDESVVAMVIDEYDRVLALNPAHVAAWANQGYIYWLLGENERAKRVLERGREFKEMRRETFVAQLDHTLTRIAAEEGRFADAYRSYVSAVTANFAEGISHAPDGYTAPDFEGMTEAMLARFEAYRDKVTDEWRDYRRTHGARGHRVANSVRAFVLNDCAEASMNLGLRSGDPKYLDRAREMLLEARDLNPRYPMIFFNLQRLDRWKWQEWWSLYPPDPSTLSDDDLANYTGRFAQMPSETDHIERVLRYEPRWPDGMMALSLAYSQQAHGERTLRRRLLEAAEKCTDAAEGLEAQSLESGVADRFDPALPDERQSEVRKLVHHPVVAGQDGRTATLPFASAEPPVPPAREGAKGEAERAAALLEAAERIEERAAELLASAENHERKAEMNLRRLLPHAWLWLPDGTELDLSLLGRADLDRRREWERSFDDLHARALLLWCSLRLERARREEEEEEAEAERPRRARVRLRPRQETKPKIRPEHLFPALQLCQDHFWPDDLYILGQFANSEWVDETRRGTCRETIQRATRHIFERDPVYWTLWHLDEDAPELEEVLRSAAERRGIPRYLYVLLGWRLDRLDRPDLALTAYAKALESKQPEVLLDLADKLAEGGHWDERRRALVRAKAADRLSSDARRRSDDYYHREIGRSLWELGRLESALGWFTRVSGDDDNEAWRTAIVARLVEVEQQKSKETYRLLKRWLGHDLTRAQVQGRTAMRRDAASALLLLTRSWYHELVHRRRNPEPARMIEAAAATVPIMIEADPGFFPSGEKSRAVKRLVEKELPAMRMAIEAETGVEIPAIWIRPTPDLGEGRYRLCLNEAPLAEGVLTQEQRYVVDENGDDHTGPPGRDPLTGRAVFWVRKRSNGLAYDRYTYIVRHLSSVVLANLGELLSTEAAGRMLDRWVEQDPGNGERASIRARHLDDERPRARFVRLLRTLAAERIPLADLDPVVRTFGAAPETETIALAERVREALRVAEQVVDPSELADVLPPDVEDRLADWIHHDGTRRVLALPPDLLADLKKVVKDTLEIDQRTALVVLRPDLRPYVRRLVAQVDPRRDVLARSELRDVVLLSAGPAGAPVEDEVAP